MDYCKEGFDKTRKILSQLENISIDPPSGDDNSENIELIINKINDLQKEIAEIHDVLDTIDKKTFIGLINENEKKIEKKLNENKNSISDYNKKIGESLTKLQEQFEQLKSKIYVNSE